jgi:hypothetical protein
MKNKRGEKDITSNSNKLILKQNTQQKVNQFLSESEIDEKEVYLLIRDFFKKYLNLDYEFTNEELKKELRSVYWSDDLKQKTQNLFTILSKMEYFSKPLSNQQLNQLLLDFKEIIDDIVIVHYKKEATFLKKIKDALHKFVSFPKKPIQINQIPEKITPELAERPKSIIQEPTISEKVQNLLDDIELLKEKDFKSAKIKYSKLLQLYNTMDDNQKKEHFKSIQQAYKKLKNKNHSS